MDVNEERLRPISQRDERSPVSEEDLLEGGFPRAIDTIKR